MNRTSADCPRERVLAAGIELLVTEGLRAATTERIARRAHVSKKTLYRLFHTKEHLVETLVEAFIETHLQRWDVILDSDAPAIDRILESLEWISQVLPTVNAALMQQAGQIGPTAWALIDAARMRRLTRMQDLMRQAQADGWFRSDIAPEHWALLFTGTIRAVLTPKVLLETGYRLADLARTVKAIYYEGLLTAQGRNYIEKKSGEEG